MNVLTSLSSFKTCRQLLHLLEGEQDEKTFTEVSSKTILSTTKLLFMSEYLADPSETYAFSLCVKLRSFVTSVPELWLPYRGGRLLPIGMQQVILYFRDVFRGRSGEYLVTWFTVNSLAIIICWWEGVVASGKPWVGSGSETDRDTQGRQRDCRELVIREEPPRRRKRNTRSLHESDFFFPPSTRILVI